MGQKSIERILNRAEDAWSRKQKWDDLYEEAYEFAMPNRSLYDKQAPGESKMDRVFDSTAMDSTQNFANRMQNQLTPPFEKWFQLKAGDVIPEQKRDKINRKLERISNVIWQVLNTGYFNSASHETYMDLAAGTGAMLVLEGNNRDRPVRFESVPSAHVAIDEGPFGEVGGVFRKHKVKGRLIEEQWPDAEVKGDLADKVQKQPNDEIEFWEITYEGDSEEGDENDGGPLSSGKKVWYYEIIWQGGDRDESQRIVERQYNENPWMVPRWSKVPGENHGRGPLLQALPDIKTLNKVVELTLKNASLAISAPYTVTNDGVTNPDNIRIEPGALNIVGRNAGPNGPSIKPLETSRNFDVAQLERDDLRMQIKKMLYDDKLPPQDQGTPRSATEIMQRVKKLQKDIGGSFGRLYQEFQVPLVQRVASILHNKGLIDIPIVIDQLGVRLQVSSPISQKQNINDVQKITQWLEMIKSFGGQQAITMAAKPEEIFQEIGEKLGVPQRLIRTDAERKQVMKRLKKMAEKQKEEMKEMEKRKMREEQKQPKEGAK